MRLILPVPVAAYHPHGQRVKHPSALDSVTFLVAVNQTDTKCLANIKTSPLKPGKVHNSTEYIYVGKCDYGTLDFNITSTGTLLYLVPLHCIHCYHVFRPDIGLCILGIPFP